MLIVYLDREGNGTPLQHSCLENPMGGGAWWAAVHGVAKSWTRLSDFTFTFHLHALEKEMATHSSALAWRIPGTGSLVGCRLWGRTESDMTEATQQQQQQYILKGLPRSCSGKESACQCRRSRDMGSIHGSGRFPLEQKMATTPEFFPGKFHGQKSLVGYSSWDHKELDMTNTHSIKNKEKIKYFKFYSTVILQTYELTHVIGLANTCLHL